MHGSSLDEIEIPVLYYLFKSFGCQKVKGQIKAKCPSALKTLFPHENKAADEDFDLFGEQTAEEKAVCTQSAKKNVDKAVAEKKKKKEVINKSTLVIEIKPNNLDTDLIAVEKAVREIKMDGLDWAQASKKVPIAFGLNKLQMGCSIVDDLIATDDIIERIESIGMTQAQADEYRKKREAGDNDDDEEEEAPGWVQSAEIVSFQKL